MVGSGTHGGSRSLGSGVSSVNWKTGGAGSAGGGDGDADGGGGDGDADGGGGDGSSVLCAGGGASAKGEDDEEGEGCEGGDAGGADGGLTQVPHWPSSGDQYGVANGHSHLGTHCSVHTGSGSAHVWLHAEPQEFHDRFPAHRGVELGAPDSPGPGGGRYSMCGGEEGAKVKTTLVSVDGGPGGKGEGEKGGGGDVGGRDGGEGPVSCKIHQIGTM